MNKNWHYFKDFLHSFNATFPNAIDKERVFEKKEKEEVGREEGGGNSWRSRLEIVSSPFVVTQQYRHSGNALANQKTYCFTDGTEVFKKKKPTPIMVPQ